MVKLFGRKRQDRDELDAQILEDVDLSAIVKQRRRQQESEAKREREHEAETRHEPQGKSEARLEVSTVPDLLKDEFLEWLIDQALRDDRKYEKLMQIIDSLGLDDLRRLCRMLLQRLRQVAR